MDIYIVMQEQHSQSYEKVIQIESLYLKAFYKKKDAENFVSSLPTPKIVKGTWSEEEEKYYIETLEIS